jgi:hypothetical protein
MVKGERAEAPVLCSDVSFRLDQKTENFKVVPAITTSSAMQRSVLTEEKQKNQIGASCANRVSLHENDNNNDSRAAAAITIRPLPPHQRCTAAKDG